MRNRTVTELTNFSDYPEFERLCTDILTGTGYRGIDPQGIEGKDGGKDALLLSGQEDTVFQFTTREDWEAKLFEDLDKVRKQGLTCTKFVYVSNRKITGTEKDQMKEVVREDYGWELEIWDVERLRVELDNHRQDLREKYLDIPLNRTNHVDETIDALTSKCNSETTGTGFDIGTGPECVHLFSVPHSKDPHLMGLFDQQYNFKKDEDRLKEILKYGLIPWGSSLRTRIQSDRFTAYSTTEPPQSSKIMNDFFSPDPTISKVSIYDSGVVESQNFVHLIDLSKDTLDMILELFFKVFNLIYRDEVAWEGKITFVCQILNADKIRYKKADGFTYTGESWLFREIEEETYDELSSNQDEFTERTLNKAHHFFNTNPELDDDR